MCVVNKPIQDGIGHGWIADKFKPVFKWNLRGNDRGANTLAVFNDLQQIPAFGVGHASDTKIINDQYFDFCELVHEFGVGAIGSGDSDFLVKDLPEDSRGAGKLSALGAL